MKQTTVSILVQLYNWLLRLYPSDCRVELVDEMRAVFIAIEQHRKPLGDSA